MTLRSAVYRLGSFLRHRLTAWNTGGEGIHSPSLFYLVRMILYDNNAYYAYAPIERQRRRLLACPDSVRQVDYGTGAAAQGTPVRRRVKDIARTHLESPAVGQLLFRLANYLTGQQKRPLVIVELGTSLGISTAYLASPAETNNVITYEGAPDVAKIAAGVWKDLGLANIRSVVGNIDATLPDTCPEHVDLAFLDANHTCEATLRYFRTLLPAAHPHSIFVVDDIHHSPDMQHAWQQIRALPEVTTTLDCYHFGIVLFNPHYIRKHYRLLLKTASFRSAL